MKKNMNKNGALELSIGTIVVIVIGMSMLVLGLVLVRTIFTGSQESVDLINEGVRQEIVNLFADEQGNLLIKLGATNTAKVKPGTRFNIAIGARDPDGRSVTRDSLQFMVTLDENSQNDCISILGKDRTERIFVTKLNQWNNFGEFDGSTTFDLISVDVPKGTARCVQKVNIDLKTLDSPNAVAGGFFLMEITKEGIFG